MVDMNQFLGRGGGLYPSIGRYGRRSDAPVADDRGPIAFSTGSLIFAVTKRGGQMSTITISISKSMEEWIEDQVEEGGFASADDYLGNLVRQDQERRLEELRRIVDEGLASGISTRTFEERIAEGDRIVRTRRTGNARI
jgi:antitoxin ParD1/3/4